MFRIESKPFGEIESDALVVNLFEDEGQLPADLAGLDEATNGVIGGAIKDKAFSGTLFELAGFYRPKGLRVTELFLIGSGTKREFNYEVASEIAGTAARHARMKGAREVVFLMRGELPAELRGRACVEGVLLGTFEIGKYKTKNPSKPVLDSVVILPTKIGEEDELRKGAERGRSYAEATNYARSIVNEPSNVLTPRRLAEEASALAKEFGMEADVLGPDRMRENGMNAILGVGKGLTFDSGGISLKEPDGMHYMKTDMAGGAAVLGAMRVIGELKPQINVIGVVAAAENMPGGGAQKPGDIVKAFNGKTIEVLDTDAEGRLVLADAISYARHLGATHLVDIATLTGSCIIALGEITTGAMTNDERWATQVMEAAKYAGEKMWLLPTFQDYRELIESEIADITNIARRRVAHSNARPAGTIVGAMFLREFAEDTPWVHLDIAGTAWNSRKLEYLAVGPTGVGVRTLATLVLSMNANS